jgi:hypothetical protein
MKTKALSFILGIVLLGCAAQPSSQNASVKSASSKSEAGKHVGWKSFSWGTTVTTNPPSAFRRLWRH